MFVEAQVPGPVVQCLHDLRNGQAVGRLRPDLNAVYVGIFGLMALALVLDYIVVKIEAKFKW